MQYLDRLRFVITDIRDVQERLTYTGELSAPCRRIQDDIGNLLPMFRAIFEELEASRRKLTTQLGDLISQ
jgi:hypothetical protein